MLKTKILLSVYLAFMVVLGLHFLRGTRGLEAVSQLEAHKTLLKSNLEDLKRLNGYYHDQFDLLGSDKEKVTLSARELGYYQPGEKVVIIRGLGEKQKTPLSPGEAIEFRAKDSFAKAFFPAAWVVLALLSYLLLEVLFRIFPKLGEFTSVHLGPGKNLGR